MKLNKICLLVFLVGLVLCLPAYTIKSNNENKVYYIPVKGEINYGLASFIDRAISKAKENNVQLIILGIDTFGGRVDACLEIVDSIESTDNIPTVAFIEDKAWSAGALIALACEKIVMKKASSIGSAAPVGGKGEELGEKYVSALRTKFSALAEKNGYPPNIARAMVDKEIQVQEVTIDGKIKYLSKQEIEALKEKRERFKLGDIISKEGKLLNLTYNAAKKYNVASAITNELSSLPGLYNLAGVDIVDVKRNWADHLAIFFTSTLVSSLLLSLGFIFIYMEFSEPGLGWPGLIGLMCFSLFFFGRYIVNLASWLDIILFSIGIIFIILEIFVIPGFGIPGIAGMILVLISLYLALSPYKIPRQPWDFETLQTNLLMILGNLTISIIAGFILFSNLHRIPLLNRIVLNKSMKDKEDNQYSVEPGEKLQLGDKGIALTDLRPVGRVRFEKKVYDAISQEGYIEKGKKVKIIEISGNRILVNKEVS